jgi:hypothetical protein
MTFQLLANSMSIQLLQENKFQVHEKNMPLTHKILDNEHIPPISNEHQVSTESNVQPLQINKIPTQWEKIQSAEFKGSTFAAMVLFCFALIFLG